MKSFLRTIKILLLYYIKTLTLYIFVYSFNFTLSCFTNYKYNYYFCYIIIDKLYEYNICIHKV